MFDVLLRYSSQYSKSIIFPVEHSVSIFSKSAFRQHFTLPCGSDNFEKRISTFLFMWFYHWHGNTNDIVLFIVSRLSTQIQLSISGLLIVMGKPIRNAYLGIVKHDRNRLFSKEPIGNIFFLHMATFEIPKYCFIIKPPACWGADVSIGIYELLLLFNIISLCVK